MNYVGVKLGKRSVFKSERNPTKSSHGHIYDYCIGPFQSIEAAEYMSGPGYLQFWCITPNDAERLVGGAVARAEEVEEITEDWCAA
jgi:hypothetical protein